MDTINSPKYSKIESLIISFALIAIAGISFGLAGLMTILTTSDDNYQLINTIWLSLFMIIFFIILPLFLAGRFYGISLKDLRINHKMFLIYLIAGYIFLRFALKIDRVNIVRNMVVANSEEFMFRFLIFEILKRSFSKKESIVIGSLLFALILHLNVGILVNLISKFPMAIVLYILYDKLGFEHAFALHWLNNSLVDYFYL